MRLAYSYTKIRDFLTCKKLFKLKHLDKIPYKENDYLIVGSLIHRLLEKYTAECYKNKITHLGQESIDRIINSTLEEYPCDEVFENEAVEVFKHYISGTEIDIENLAGIEERVAVDIDFDFVDWQSEDVFFRCIIDKLYIKDNVAKIADYKTGYKMATDKLQLEIYAWIISKIFPQIDVFNIELDYVRYYWKQEDVITRNEIEGISARIYRYINAIETETEFKPKFSNHCYTCPYWNMCDLVKEIPLRFNPPQNAEEAKELLDTLLKLKLDIKQIEELLKAYVEKNGSVSSDEAVATYTPVKSLKVDVVKFLENANKSNVNVVDFIKVDTAKLMKQFEKYENILADSSVIRVNSRFSIVKKKGGSDG